MSESALAAGPPVAASVTFPRSGTVLLQRKCACGGAPGLDDECEACREERLQRAPNGVAVLVVPPIVHETLHSPGQPLNSDTRAFMEARLGHNFGQVRVHTDARAAESAQAVNALAYTVGRDIAFDSGQYSPGSAKGRDLLAHELAHTIQQENAVSSSALWIDQDSRLEREAEWAGQQVAAPPWMRPGLAPLTGAGVRALQRKLKVNDPGTVPAGGSPSDTNEKIVRDYVSTLCSDFTVTSGEVTPNNAAVCASTPGAARSESCDCLCDMTTLRDATGAEVTWTIAVNDNDWPHTDDSTQTVTVQSPFSGMRFGAWTQGPASHRVMDPNWLVLGHELCGHARLMAHGTHPTGPAPTAGGRPSHDRTVQIENKIAKEHGIPTSELRGLFADPHHGESFARVSVGPFTLGDASLQPGHVAQLNTAAAFIASAPVKMDVIGHADQRESNVLMDMGFSQTRADNVKANLVARGIDPARFLTTNGVGARECTQPGNQPDCRNVEIFMFLFEGASVTNP